MIKKETLSIPFLKIIRDVVLIFDEVFFLETLMLWLNKIFCPAIRAFYHRLR